MPGLLDFLNTSQGAPRSGGLLGNLEQFRQDNPGVLSMLGAGIASGNPFAAVQQAAPMLAQGRRLKGAAQFMLARGIAKNPEEAALLAESPELIRFVAKDPDQFSQRADAARQYGLDPSSPDGKAFILSGEMPKPGSQQHSVINAGNGMLYDQDKGEWITAPQQGLGGLGTDANDAPVLAPGQRDDAYLAALDPNMQSIVKGLANYELDLPKISSIRGNQRMQLAAAAKRYDPSFDMTQYGARAAMRKSMTSGNYSQAINSSNLVIQHLDSLKKAAADLGNTDYKMLNAGKNLWNSQTGDPAITKFNTIADAAASELAKVFKGVGVTSDAEIREWRKNLDPNSSPEQIKASIETAISQLLASRLDTIRSQFGAAMGRPADFTILTAHSRAVIRALGIDPDQLEHGGGDGVTAPSGGGGTASSGVQWSIEP